MNDFQQCTDKSKGSMNGFALFVYDSGRQVKNLTQKTFETVNCCRQRLKAVS